MTDNPQVRRLADWDAAYLRGLAEEFETPLYAIDLDRIRENGARLRAAFPDADIAYAVKANTIRPVLETLAAEGFDAECASAGEVQRALDAGFPGRAIRYTAVNPPAGDLDHVVGLADERDLDLVVTVGAEDTLDRLAERGFDGRLCVRVNPGVGAGHHAKVATGAEPKFGVPYERAPEMVEIARAQGEVVGLHAHVGSGVSGDALDVHRDLVGRMGDLARRVAADTDPDLGLQFVSVGGGFGIPYREDEEPLDLDAVARATRDALGEVDARLAIEPGRYFVADAGVLLTRVNTVKHTPETTVVGIDAGMTALVRPAMYGAYHAVRSLAADADERETVSAELAGPVCETADVLGRDRPVPKPRRNDLLAVGNAGAYGYEMAIQYNSRPRPAVVALDGDGDGDSDGDGEGDGDDDGEGDSDSVRLAIRRETLADLTRLACDAEHGRLDERTEARGRGDEARIEHDRRTERQSW